MRVEIGQKYVSKCEEEYDVPLRVLGINSPYVELERCEHHEGLTHESFPLRIDYLLEHYELISEVQSDQ